MRIDIYTETINNYCKIIMVAERFVCYKLNLKKFTRISKVKMLTWVMNSYVKVAAD